MLVSSRCKRKFFFSQVNFRLIGVNYFYLIKINKNSKKIPKLQQDSVVEDITKKFNLLPVFEIFENVVKFESRESLKYEVLLFSKAKLSVKNEARKYTDSIKKLGIDNGLHQYLCKDTHNVEINPECFCPDCTNCSCCFFLDAAVCIHLVGCCLLDSFDFPGVKPKKFLSKTKSKKRKAGPWHQKD